MTPSPDIRFVEEIAANAWPPYIQQVVDGWRLRFTPDVRARRSNSVLPIADSGRSTLEDRMSIVEEFYGTRGEPVRYQVSPAAVPAELDSVLDARGYHMEAPVDVQVAQLSDVLTRTEQARSSLQIEPRPTDQWLQLWTNLFQRGDPGTTRRRVLDRIAPSARFAFLALEGQGAAVGMGVVERGWLGVYAWPEFA